MSSLPYFINTPSLDGNRYKDKILKVLYDTGEKFTSVRFVNCGNPNQHFAALYNLGLTTNEPIPNSNGTMLRFISEEQREKAGEYLQKRRLISNQDEIQTSSN